MNALGRGLGLAPGDSCYDPNHPWYLPNLLDDSAECACIAAERRPLGEQCATFSGVVQTMGAQVGEVAGEVVSGVGAGVGAGAASAVNATTIPGMLLIGAVVVLGIYLLKELR